MTSGALLACSVERTRWPVAAAEEGQPSLDRESRRPRSRQDRRARIAAPAKVSFGVTCTCVNPRLRTRWSSSNDIFRAGRDHRSVYRSVVFPLPVGLGRSTPFCAKGFAQVVRYGLRKPTAIELELAERSRRRI